MLSIFSSKSKSEPADKRAGADKAPAAKAPLDKREAAPAARPASAGKSRSAAVATAEPAAASANAGSVTAAPPTPVGPAGTIEQRGANRREAARVASITGVRISPYGAQAMLVNISESGILVECSVRMQHGNAVTVNFEGTFSPRTVEGRVARHCVAAMGRDGTLRYHAGIAFNERISLGDEEPMAAEPEPAPAVVAAAPVVPAPIVRNRW